MLSIGMRCGLAAALLLAGTGAVNADDWPQFRRDPSRSAASKDRLQFPLTDVWTWSTRGPSNHSPLYHAVAWKDRIFFTAVDGGYRYLVCAEVKTGRVHWKQRLLSARLRFSISDIAGPAVTNTGMVYVYDWIPGVGVSASQVAQSAVEGSSFVVRTFDAMNGAEGPNFPLVAMGANGVLPRLSLMNTPIGQEVRPVPPTFVGCPP